MVTIETCIILSEARYEQNVPKKKTMKTNDVSQGINMDAL